MSYTYVLRSERDNQLYTGTTRDLRARLPHSNQVTDEPFGLMK